MLGVNPGTCKSQLFKARAKMRNGCFPPRPSVRRRGTDMQHLSCEELARLVDEPPCRTRRRTCATASSAAASWTRCASDAPRWAPWTAWSPPLAAWADLEARWWTRG
jgi:hypothetical protein